MPDVETLIKAVTGLLALLGSGAAALWGWRHKSREFHQRRGEITSEAEARLRKDLEAHAETYRREAEEYRLEVRKLRHELRESEHAFLLLQQKVDGLEVALSGERKENTQQQAEINQLREVNRQQSETIAAQGREIDALRAEIAALRNPS